MSKKVKAEMFGVRYPDGRVVWDDGSSFVYIRSESDRQKFVEARNRQLSDCGVKDDPGVVFLRRYRVITHTEPEII